MAKIVIADSLPSHSTEIQALITSFYNARVAALATGTANVNLVAGDFHVAADIEAAYDYAEANSDVLVIIYATNGIEFHISGAEAIYPRVQVFSVMGSNTSTDMEIFSVEEPPVVITCGAGTSKNETGYGKGLEFWHEDDTVDGSFLSSYSTAKILAGMLFMKEDLDLTWWELRWRCRILATRTETTRYPVNSWWDIKNGYGMPLLIPITGEFYTYPIRDVYKGATPADPYQHTQAEVDQLVIDLAAANATIATLQSHEAYFDESNIRTGFVVNIDTDFGISEFALLSTYELKDDSKLHATLKLYKDLTSYTAGKEPLHTITYRCASTQTLNNILYQFLKVNVSALTSGTFNLVAV